MNMMEALRARYSCRKFSAKKVPDALLEKLLEAARIAPSAANRQPARVRIVDRQEALERLAQSRKGFFKEPCVMVFSYDRAASWKRADDGYDSGIFDVGLAVMQVCLAARELGLETCIVMAYDAATFLDAFPLPPDEELVCQVSLGYPAADAVPGPKHEQRNPMPLRRLD